jgi:fatty acid synthase subunit alpha
MKSIFPGAIDGDLLKLVHLSNSFRMVEGAKPLEVGDICRPEARIIFVTNSSEGKIVKSRVTVIAIISQSLKSFHLSSTLFI